MEIVPEGEKRTGSLSFHVICVIAVIVFFNLKDTIIHAGHKTCNPAVHSH